MTHLDLTFKALHKLKLGVEPRLKLLDVGCGNPKANKDYLNYHFEWHGIDCRDEFSDCDNYSVGTMEDMHMLEANSFDVIFACHSLEHCRHPIEALEEFKRIVKPNGIIFISGPLHCKHQILEADEDHIFVFTDIQLQRLIKYVGLELKQQWVEWSSPADDKASSLITVCTKNE